MSVVYKISLGDNHYIGSCNNLRLRINCHKYNCYNEKREKKLYQVIRENYEWKDVVFEILEQHDTVLDNLELRKREQHFIDEMKPSLNMVKAYITEEQRVERDKINKKEYGKKYREENIEYIIEYNKEYRKKNREKINKKYDCDCGGKYGYKGKSTHLKSKKHQKYLADLELE